MDSEQEFDELMFLWGLKLSGKQGSERDKTRDKIQAKTRENLIEIVNMSDTSYRKIIKGKYPIAFPVLLKICLALNIGIAEIEEIIRSDLEQ